MYIFVDIQQILQNKYHDLFVLAHAASSRQRRSAVEVEIHQACDPAVEADHLTLHSVVGVRRAIEDQADQLQRQQQDDQNL